MRRMRLPIGLLILPLLLLATGCNEQPISAAPLSAPPDVRIPIGPIPGPGKAMNLPVNPYANNAIAIEEGRQLFVWFNCAGCHGGHGGGGMGPSLRDPVWRYGGDDAHIFSSIAEGRGQGMPAWGTKIPEDQIWKLAAYIKSLRTPQEPDPPNVPPVPEVKQVKRPQP